MNISTDMYIYIIHVSCSHRRIVANLFVQTVVPPVKPCSSAQVPETTWRSLRSWWWEDLRREHVGIPMERIYIYMPCIYHTYTITRLIHIFIFVCISYIYISYIYICKSHIYIYTE